jgi:hypothetical protein
MEGQSKYDETKTVIRNVMKMFERRGYSMGEAKKKYELILSNNSEVKKLYDENTFFIILQAISGNVLHYAFIVRKTEKLKKRIIEEIENFISRDENNMKKNAIIIANRAGQKKQKLDGGTTFELFQYDEFLYDIYDHYLSAKYEKVDQVWFAKTFEIKKLSELQRIPPTDKFVAYLGFKENDVIKIETLNEISQSSITYKIVM